MLPCKSLAPISTVMPGYIPQLNWRSTEPAGPWLMELCAEAMPGLAHHPPPPRHLQNPAIFLRLLSVGLEGKWTWTFKRNIFSVKGQIKQLRNRTSAWTNKGISGGNTPSMLVPLWAILSRQVIQMLWNSIFSFVNSNTHCTIGWSILCMSEMPWKLLTALQNVHCWKESTNSKTKDRSLCGSTTGQLCDLGHFTALSLLFICKMGEIISLLPTFGVGAQPVSLSGCQAAVQCNWKSMFRNWTPKHSPDGHHNAQDKNGHPAESLSLPCNSKGPFGKCSPFFSCRNPYFSGQEDFQLCQPNDSHHTLAGVRIQRKQKSWQESLGFSM